MLAEVEMEFRPWQRIREFWSNVDEIVKEYREDAGQWGGDVP